MKHVVLSLAAIVAALPGAAWADHPFVLPSNTSYSGLGNTVTFDAAGSDHVFFFDHRPLAPDTIAVTRPDGAAAAVTPLRTRFRTIIDVPLDHAGTWKAASVQTSIMGTLKLDGVDRRVGGRGGPPPSERLRAEGPPAAPGGEQRLPPIAVADIPATATDVHLTEMTSAAETFVTVDAPTTTVLAPRGRGLEFAPVTHPNALVAGEPAQFRFLIDGRPAAGVAVTVIAGGDRYRAADGAIGLTTDWNGIVNVRWPTAGMYWLGAEAQDRHPADPRAETRRMVYSATLEVAAP